VVDNIHLGMAAYLHYRNGFCSIGQSALCARQKNNGVFNHMLNTIYNHPRQFLTTLALGNIILLGWIIYFLIEILDPALMTLHAYEKRSGSVFFIIVVISLLTVAANQFIPRMILRKNPDGWIKIFAIPAFLYYILIYPLTRAFIQVSRFC